MNQFPQQLLKQIDELNDQISIIEKRKQLIYQRLANYKKQIENENCR